MNMLQSSNVQCTLKHNNLPYINSELRKFINVKNMLRRKYTRDNTEETGMHIESIENGWLN